MSRPVISKRCLANMAPELTSEWHPVKNGKLTPSDVSFGSHKKSWWMCNKGHEWAASVASRATSLKVGCPYCANKMVCVDNCLATIHPELVNEWQLTRNNSLTPHDVVSKSGKYVWWICHKGHEWESRVADRVDGYGCPYCSNKKICKDNCLATMRPEISQQWNPIKNGKLTPNDVTPGSNKNVWWMCGKGHEWESRVADRTRRGHHCPYCSGHKVCKDNCLATLNPQISKQWHPTKNGELTANDVSSRCNKKAWWVCGNGHEWEAIISSRTRSGCPYCSGFSACKDNCLANINPELAQHWHPTKNGGLTPNDVTPGSSKKVWWRCKRGHDWKTIIASRSGASKATCPYCHKTFLKDGAILDSLPEAVKYLEYKQRGLVFYYNQPYDKRLGKYRYDFYFPIENKYVEVTSYDRTNLGRKAPHLYFKYLRKIVKKRRFVETVLGAKFEFIQFVPSRGQRKIVYENRLD